MVERRRVVSFQGGIKVVPIEITAWGSLARSRKSRQDRGTIDVTFNTNLIVSWPLGGVRA